MIIKRKSGDLNKSYRPCRLDEVVGHDTVKKTLNNAIKKGTLPHAMLFTGPSGCGKTTFARVVGMGLNCEEGPTGNPCCKCRSCESVLGQFSMAVMEIDAGRTGDVGTTRSIIEDLPAAPMTGEPYRVVIFDEAHLLGSPSKSEEALLKFLEDTPDHVYIILCTNLPEKLKEVTRNRCKVVQFGRLTTNEIVKLLEEVCQFEGYDYKPELLTDIAKEAKGVPRAALSFLQQVASEGSWTKDSTALILNAGVDTDHAAIIDLCKCLVDKQGFRSALKVFDRLDNIPLEVIRMGICGYLVGCLKRANTANEAIKYSQAIEMLENPYFNNPKPEHKFVNTLFKISQLLRS